MLHINRILAPTDGSVCSAQAYRHAVDLADRHRATLHVLHVNEHTMEWSDVIDIREDDVLANLHDALPVAAEPATEAAITQHTITHPSAAHGILSYAAEHDMDLIVMGTHGRRGVARAVIGSVAEEVVRRSDSPVLTIRTSGDESASTTPHFDHLLVPVDFSDHTSALVRHAGALAEAYDVPVHLLHVIEQIVLPTAYGIQPPDIDDTEMHHSAREALAEYAADLQARGVDAHVLLRDGHPAHQILDAVEASSGVPLLVLSTHGRTGVQRLVLGSIAEKMVRRAPCPVFVVKAFGRSLVRDADAHASSSRSA